MKKVFEGLVHEEIEDAGAAIIAEVEDRLGTSDYMFVKLQSWDVNMKHDDLIPFLGRRVRVTVEVI